MKRIASEEEKKDQIMSSILKQTPGKEEYPDFTKLFRELSELFFEKVTSQIPREIWTLILEYTCESDEKIKESHQWVEWTMVSKKLYEAVYTMRTTFLHYLPQPQPQPQLQQFVLGRFHNLEILRIACSDSLITLPLLSHLRKLKFSTPTIPNELSSIPSYDGDKDHTPYFPRLVPKDLPNLTSISWYHKCMNFHVFVFLGNLHSDIKKRITKLKIYTPDNQDIANILEGFPSLKVLRLDGRCYVRRTHPYKWYCPLLEEIHLNNDATLLLSDFTGTARIYMTQWHLREKNNTIDNYFSTGSVENGVKVGEWKTYNRHKSLIRIDKYSHDKNDRIISGDASSLNDFLTTHRLLFG